MKNPVLYVIINKELKMSPGKVAAQAVHAAMMLPAAKRTRFMSDFRRTVIILEAKNREQLDGIADYLADAGIKFAYYVDEGVNEVDSFSFTALAVEPIAHEDFDKREIFSDLKLYSAEKKRLFQW